jgi:hypothetical protein
MSRQDVTSGPVSCADEVTPDVNGGTEVDDFIRAGVDDPRGKEAVSAVSVVSYGCASMVGCR